MNQKRFASHALRELVSSLKLPLLQAEDASSPSECFDLANSKLWLTELDWSDEAAQLREAAVSNPTAYTVELAYKLLRRLRLVDQQITELDDGLLKCAELQELTLTGNHLTSVPLHYLPPNLKVLELCYNELESTSDLRHCSLELLHLGLAYNKLSALDLQPSNWSSLLSLDLSYNRLVGLPAAIKVIVELEQLRNLSLKGNPLTLVPCYHGYTVDSLAGLTSLDDNDITALEQETVSGMADLCDKQQDLIRYARVHFKVKSLSGLPELEEVPDTAEQIMISLIEVHHSFLPHVLYQLAGPSLISVSTQNIPMPPNPNPVDIPNDANHGDMHWCRLNPLPYATSVLDCDSLATSFRVEDLLSLAQFLEVGLDVRVCLVRKAYAKEGGGEGKPQGAKPGRGTPQSGRSSATKKSQHSNTKKETKGKGKVVASGNSGPPGEGWKESSVLQLPLVTWHLELTPILEGRPLVEAMLEDTLTSALRTSAAFKSTEEGQGSDGGRVQIGVALSVDRYDCVSSCVV